MTAAIPDVLRDDLLHLARTLELDDQPRSLIATEIILAAGSRGLMLSEEQATALVSRWLDAPAKEGGQ